MFGFFDSVINTASKAFSWVNSNNAILGLASGAMKAYEANQANEINKRNIKVNERMQQFDEDKWNKTHGVIDSYDNSVPMSNIQNSSIVSGGMADAMKKGGTI